MKYSAFEKDIKRKLADREEAIDTDALIGRLNLAPKKRRGRIIYLPLFALTTLAFVALWYVQSERSGKPELSKSSIETEEAAPPAMLTALRETGTPDEMNSSTAESSATASYQTDIKHAASDAATPQPQNTRSAATASKTTADQSISASTFAKDNNPAEKANATPALSSDQASTNEAQTDVINNESPGSSSGDIDSDQITAPRAADEEQTEEIPNEDVSVVTANSVVSALPGLDMTGLTSDPILPAMKKVECPDFRLNKSWFDFEILAELGAFLPIKSFDASTIGGDEVGILRERNEVSREGYHAAIYGRLNARSIPVYVQAGLSQDFLTERMSLDYSYTRRDTTQGIISITESEDGDTITVIIGDIIKETEVSGKKIKHYRLQTIDIPLILGYTFDFDRFGFFIEGGPVFNLSLRQTGSILTSATDFEDVGTSPAFRSRIGLSYLAGAGMSYRISDRLRAYANARFRYLPNSVNDASIRPDQHYRFLGANVGLGYLF